MLQGLSDSLLDPGDAALDDDSAVTRCAVRCPSRMILASSRQKTFGHDATTIELHRTCQRDLPTVNLAARQKHSGMTVAHKQKRNLCPCEDYRRK